MFGMLVLPPSVHPRVLSFLTVHELGTCESVWKRWRVAAEDFWVLQVNACGFGAPKNLAKPFLRDFQPYLTLLNQVTVWSFTNSGIDIPLYSSRTAQYQALCRVAKAVYPTLQSPRDDNKALALSSFEEDRNFSAWVAFRDYYQLKLFFASGASPSHKLLIHALKQAFTLDYSQDIIEELMHHFLDRGLEDELKELVLEASTYAPNRLLILAAAENATGRALVEMVQGESVDFAKKYLEMFASFPEHQVNRALNFAIESEILSPDKTLISKLLRHIVSSNHIATNLVRAVTKRRIALIPIFSAFQAQIADFFLKMAVGACLGDLALKEALCEAFPSRREMIEKEFAECVIVDSDVSDEDVPASESSKKVKHSANP